MFVQFAAEKRGFKFDVLNVVTDGWKFNLDTARDKGLASRLLVYSLIDHLGTIVPCHQIFLCFLWSPYRNSCAQVVHIP